MKFLLLSLVLASRLMAGESVIVDPKEVVIGPVGAKAEFTFGFGHLQAGADEFVYGGFGPNDQLSELNWDTLHAMTVEVGATHRLTRRIKLFATGVFGMDGNSGMVDYDWLGFDSRWTDRSQHDDTELEHYFQGDLGISSEIYAKDGFDLSLRGGFRYTDVAWASFGGDYIYSTFAPLGLFRDDVGNFP
ncbi:MAG: omptin family outer membrane protease, partial [Verrucomicrobiales bacterium]